MTQRKHNHDAGVTFGETESQRKAEARAPRTDDATVTQTEHNHDAGVTFGNAEGDLQKTARKAVTIRSMAESMVELAKATARFSFDQVESGFFMLTDPGKAFRRVQHSIDNFSRAMNEPVEDAHPKS